MPRRLSSRSAAAALVGLAAAAAIPVAVGATVRLQDPVRGETVTLETAGQRALHVVFFATWCPACVGEMRRLAELEDAWRGRGYRLVVVAVRSRQDAARLAEFASGQSPPGAFYFDAFGEAELAWKPEGLPAHLLFDADGSIVARRERADASLEAAISDLLASPER